jgi:PPK2 family polyphosphate:nucleotide phosphotransferase
VGAITRISGRPQRLRRWHIFLTACRNQGGILQKTQTGVRVTYTTLELTDYQIPNTTLTFVDPASTGPYSTDKAGRSAAKDDLRELSVKLHELQRRFYADGRYALLMIFQAMDTGGKDGTIRRVLSGVNPQGVRVISFKAPSALELSHDFLWRVHQVTPAKSKIAIFNRSHYEDVLVVRVNQLVPEAVWRPRYAQINAFEELLYDSNTIILKFFLHIDKDEQAKRFNRRLSDPTRHWKFDPADLTARARWDDYMAAYQEVFARCSPTYAPWMIVPANRKWFRDVLVARTIVATLESLDLRYPEPAFDVSEYPTIEREG